VDRVVIEWLPPGLSVLEGKEWLKRATRAVKRAQAWPGMDICDRPAPDEVEEGSNIGTCYNGGKPHRHCECGLPIDLDHGYCDDCIRTLLRGGAMSGRQSHNRKAERAAWLERYGFVEFTTDGVKVKR
jgi:hypothetical protein